MMTYPIRDEHGQIFAFEIENAYISVRTIARLLRSVAGVSGVEARRPFSASRDVHVVFQFSGQRFLVWEPYGDSSRYWIGPDDDGRRPIVDLHAIEEVFRQYVVPIPVRLLGGLLTLRPLRRNRDR